MMGENVNMILSSLKLDQHFSSHTNFVSFSNSSKFEFLQEILDELPIEAHMAKELPHLFKITRRSRRLEIDSIVALSTLMPFSDMI